MAADIRQQINQKSTVSYVVGGLLLATLYYFTMFTGATKYKNQIRNLDQQIEKLRADIATNEAIVRDMKKFELEVNQISEQYQAALEYLPSKAKVEDVLDQLYKIAKTTRVSLSKVRPGGISRQKFYEEMIVDIEITGTYSDLTSFIVEVSQIPRIITIRGLKLRPSSKRSLSGGLLIELSGKLVTYRYIEEAE